MGRFKITFHLTKKQKILYIKNTKQKIVFHEWIYICLSIYLYLYLYLFYIYIYIIYKVGRCLGCAMNMSR